MTKSALDLYHHYFSEREFEHLDLFQLLAERYAVQRVLYPGSFVHITASFVFPDVVYVDTDRRAKKFFASPEVRKYIEVYKRYPQPAIFSFHPLDYRNGLEEIEPGFDLLISQYAGFIGQYCKHHLKEGDSLLANNSHGDAGVAALDPEYEFAAVAHRRNDKYRLIESNLDAYFLPKSTKRELTKEYLMDLQKGSGYTKTASNYIFRKVQ